MVALVVIQKHPSGQRNVSISSDPATQVDDLLISAGAWRDSEVVSGKVLIVAQGDSEVASEIEAALQDELRSVNNRTIIEPETAR